MSDDHEARERAMGALAEGVVLIVMGVLLQLAQRKASDPDGFRDWRMRGWKLAERFCAQSAANWWKLAERARLAYEAERP